MILVSVEFQSLRNLQEFAVDTGLDEAFMANLLEEFFVVTFAVLHNGSEEKYALAGIIVEDEAVICDIQNLLSEYSDFIIGRMGIPNVKENLSVISVVLNAPSDVINTISGKLGRIDGVTSKTIFSKAEEA